MIYYVDGVGFEIRVGVCYNVKWIVFWKEDIKIFNVLGVIYVFCFFCSDLVFFLNISIIIIGVLFFICE